MAKSSVSTSTTETAVEASVETNVAATKVLDTTADFSGVEKRLALVESRLDELSRVVESLKEAAPADNSGLAGAIAALEARVGSYIGRGR